MWDIKVKYWWVGVGRRRDDYVEVVKEKINCELEEIASYCIKRKERSGIRRRGESI
jgi:hypothetical protein